MTYDQWKRICLILRAKVIEARKMSDAYNYVEYHELATCYSIALAQFHRTW